MYAIVEIAGQQFKVEKGQQIFVNRLHEEEGSKPQCCNTSKATRLSFSRRKEEKDIRLLTVTVSI